MLFRRPETWNATYPTKLTFALSAAIWQGSSILTSPLGASRSEYIFVKLPSRLLLEAPENRLSSCRFGAKILIT